MDPPKPPLQKSPQDIAREFAELWPQREIGLLLRVAQSTVGRWLKPDTVGKNQRAASNTYDQKHAEGKRERQRKWRYKQQAPVSPELLALAEKTEFRARVVEQQRKWQTKLRQLEAEGRIGHTP